MSPPWLDAFRPDSAPLLQLLLPEVDDAMLQEVAEASYGGDVAEHLAPLRAFRDRHAALLLEWHPREVLELVRWSEPEVEGWRPGGVGRRGHVMRLFACAALLLAYGEPANNGRWQSMNETVIQLCGSLRALGEAWEAAGERFLAWCVAVLTPPDGHEEEDGFLGLALLSLATRSGVREVPAVVALCEWIDARVTALLREDQWFATREHDWLLSTNHHNLKNDLWLALGRDLRARGEAALPGNAATWVALLGRALAEE